MMANTEDPPPDESQAQRLHTGDSMYLITWRTQTHRARTRVSGHQGWQWGEAVTFTAHREVSGEMQTGLAVVTVMRLYVSSRLTDLDT